MSSNNVHCRASNWFEKNERAPFMVAAGFLLAITSALTGVPTRGQGPGCPISSCTTDADCNDDVDCTLDSCEDSKCSCLSNNDCNFAVPAFVGANRCNSAAWFAFTAPCDSIFRADGTAGLCVYTDCPLNGGAELGCGGSVEFSAISGATYLIQVAGNMEILPLNLCVIDGQCFAVCDLNPENDSQACIPKLSTDEWSPRCPAPPSSGLIDGIPREGTACNCDRDGDGLYDIWETTGIDADGDGMVDFVLAGANPDHKDLYVEVDAMAGRAPADSTLAAVRVAFADVPNALLNNPDLSDGIALHYELDDTSVPGTSWLTDPWAAFYATKANYFGTDGERTNANATNILAAKRKAYRYCIFADRIDGKGTSGLAFGRPSADFMVTLGQWRTPEGTLGATPSVQAGTFMHELGHALGLDHGGGDPLNYKPNYRSVMNYIWQTPKPDLPGWDLFYSPAVYGSLNEDLLDETDGLAIGGIIGGKTYSCRCVLPGCPGDSPQRSYQVIDEVGPVDWNRDGDRNDTTVMEEDVNCNGAIEVLGGYDDWSNLQYGVPQYSLEDRELRQGAFDELDLPTQRAMEQLTCVSDVECDDGTPCTYQACSAGVCEYTLIGFGNVDGAGIVELGDILCVLGGYDDPNACPNGDIAPDCTGDDPPFIELADVLGVLDAYGGGDLCGCIP